VKVRPWASLVAALTLVGALAGCSVFASPMTQKPYDASDGVSATVGDVRLLNVLVFTEDGEDGNLAGAAVNSSDSDVDLVVQYESDGDKVNVELEVPARTTVHFGAGESGQLFLPGIDTAAGALLKVYFQYGGEQGKQIDVPVLDDRLPEYDGLLPTPTPTPTPTVTATPEPTETPAP
jgi:hypothetical protein